MTTTDAPLLRADVVVADGTTTLLGWDGRPWVLDGLAADLAQALRECTGQRRRHNIAAGLSSSPVEVWDALLDELAGVGLIGEVERSAHVVVIGSGTLAQHVALGLARGGHSLELIDPSPPEPGRYPVEAETGADALHHWLRARGVPAQKLRTGGHWLDLGWQDTPTLVVVAGATAATDRAITDHLVRVGLAHLVLEAHRRLGVVGPLVVPGRSACQCCVDLARGALMPTWPHAVAQQSTRRAVVAEEVAVWVAAQAGLVVQAHLGGADDLPITSGSPDLGVETRRWPRQPACACALWPASA